MCSLQIRIGLSTKSLQMGIIQPILLTIDRRQAYCTVSPSASAAKGIQCSAPSDGLTYITLLWLSPDQAAVRRTRLSLPFSCASVLAALLNSAHPSHKRYMISRLSSQARSSAVKSAFSRRSGRLCTVRMIDCLRRQTAIS